MEGELLLSLFLVDEGGIKGQAAGEIPAAS
jgi:hypothetical protein